MTAAQTVAHRFEQSPGRSWKVTTQRLPMKMEICSSGSYGASAGICMLTKSWSPNSGVYSEFDMQAQLQSSSRRDEALPFEKPAILLVEDEATTRLMAARQLRRAGYEVEVAENGQQALERLRQRLLPI